MRLIDLLNLTPEKIADIRATIDALPTLRERLNMPRPPKPWSPDWVVPVQPEALDAFSAKLARVNTRAANTHASVRRRLFKEWGGECVYCGCALRHPDASAHESPLPLAVADHLIPLTGGGTCCNVRVLACVTCNNHKGMMDWLEWGQARSKKVHKQLTALRMEASRRAFNHLSQDPVKVRTGLMIGRMLDARWQHPRFRVYASVTSGGAFIGIKSTWYLPQAALFIIKGLKGQLVPHNRGLWVFSFDKPTAALEAIWALIDINGWALGFDLEPEGFPEIAPKGAPQWRFWSPNFKDLARRELAKDRRKWAWKKRRDRE